MKQILENNNIEHRDSDKYYVQCPKCSGDRKKAHSRTLMVATDGEFVRFKCLHEGQCDWNKTQSYRLKDSTQAEITTPSETYTTFPNDFTHPILEKSKHYVYRNKEGSIELYIVRVDKEEGKYFYPVAMTTDLELVQKMPPQKLMYGAHLLDPKKQRPVIIVEGEKAADAARDIFKKADVVTWPGGSGNINKGDWELLSGREVYLWPDHDEVGLKAMNQIADKLDTDIVKVVDVSTLPKGYDLADDIPKDTIAKLWSEAKLIERSTNLITLDSIGFLERVKKTYTGLSLGWDNMDDEVRLPQSGLVTVLGRTSHGKSTLLMNMAIKHLQQTDRPIVYYSYEVPAHRMLIKALMILHGVQYNPVPHENDEVYRQKVIDNDLPSWNWLEPKLNSQFFLTDEPDSIEKIYETLDRRKFNNAIVYLDYLQLIPITGKISRYEKLQKISNTLRAIANKRNIVIITGSQIIDGETPLQDQAREAKDIEQASELVIRIWNKVVAEARGVYKEVKDEETKQKVIQHYYNEVSGNFALHILKNRNGEPNKKFGFDLVHGVSLKKA